MPALDRNAVLDQVAARLEAERRGLIPPDFVFWMQWAVPRLNGQRARWDARHFQHMGEVLNGVTAGRISRAMYNVAIRHGKTEFFKGYASYRMERDPYLNVLWVTHGIEQAKTVSKDIKEVVTRRGVKLSPSINQVTHWQTVEGRGLRALGINAKTASANAGLIIIDDPIGNRKEAESQTQRDAVWMAMTNDIIARATPGTAVIFSMPRWHEDDPSGRIIDRQRDQWHIVDLPGRAEEDDPLGREVGEPLWPEERGEKFMTEARAQLTAYGWASLMQCRPRPREGSMFKWEWWAELDAVPATGQMVRYWDTAGTDVTGDNDPDYTAGCLMARMPRGQTPIVNIERFRHGLAQRNAKMFEIAQRDRAQFGNRVTWWIETETGIGGRERMTELLRLLQSSGLAVRADPRGNMKDKTLRAEPLAAAAEAGNVPLCPGDWRNPFREEAAMFPGGRHDDQIDAAAGAFAKLAIQPSYHFGSFKA